MTKAQIYLYILVVFTQVFAISYFMEVYKKTIRKNKAKVWENKLLGLGLSILSVIILVVTNIFKPVLGSLGAPLWVDYIATALVLYLAQLGLSMKVIKKLTASAIRNFLKDKGLTDAQIKEMFEYVKDATEEEK